MVAVLLLLNELLVLLMEALLWRWRRLAHDVAQRPQRAQGAVGRHRVSVVVRGHEAPLEVRLHGQHIVFPGSVQLGLSTVTLRSRGHFVHVIKPNKQKNTEYVTTLSVADKRFGNAVGSTLNVQYGSPLCCGTGPAAPIPAPWGCRLPSAVSPPHDRTPRRRHEAHID